MKYGSPVWYGNRPFKDAFKTLAKLGFDFVEFSIDYPLPEKLDESLGELTKEYGLELAFHAEWGGINLAHPREEISQASLTIAKKCVNFVKDYEPLYLNFHVIADVPTLKFPEVEEEVLKVGIRSLKEISEVCKKYHVPLAIENNPWFLFGVADHFDLIFREVKDVNLCMDVGHLVRVNHEIERVERWAKKSKSLRYWLNRFKEEVLAVHLHDCTLEDNEVVDHLLLGQGELDLEEVCNYVRKSKCKYLVPEVYLFRERKRIKELTLKHVAHLKNNLELCKFLMEVR